MTYEELKAHADHMDNFMGPEPFTSPHGTCEVATLRATLEVAVQLAYLNENGLGLSNVSVRGSNLCVSIEQSLC